MTPELLTIVIAGQEYKIKLGEQDPAYIQELANYVEKKIQEVKEHYLNMSLEKILVIACLFLADEVHNYRTQTPISNDKQADDKMLLKKLIELKNFIDFT